MPRVVDANGVTYALEGADLTKALASGQVKLAESAAVADAAGNRYGIGPDTDARRLAINDPVGFESDDAARGRREAAYREDLYGSQNIRAGLEGVASGLTLGASDVALDALGADTKARAEYNPNIRMAGELTGIVGASVIPGLGAGRLGQVLAKTPAGFISAKTTQLGNAIGGVKGMVAAQALEGAGYAVGQTASQLLITDEPLSAEAVWAELGKNAAFGAGAGAAGGVILGGLGKGYTALKKARASAAPIVDLASPEGQQVVRTLTDSVNEVDGAATDLLDEAVRAADIDAQANDMLGRLAQQKYTTIKPDGAVKTGPGSDMVDSLGGVPAASAPPVGPNSLYDDVYIGGAYDAPESLVIDPTRPAGGSQGGKWAKDDMGDYWFTKQYDGNVERLAAENAANRLYLHMGIDAPKSQLVDMDGTMTYASLEKKLHKPADLPGLKGASDVKQGFVVDAWLANWDVLGQDLDNVLVKNGKVARIDNGGSFNWRAQGGNKEFGPEVDELFTMREPGNSAARIFGDLSDQEIARQIDQFALNYEQLAPKLHEVLMEAGMSGEQLFQTRNVLMQRAQWLIKDAKLELNLPTGRADDVIEATKSATQQLADHPLGMKKLYVAGLTEDEEGLLLAAQRTLKQSAVENLSPAQAEAIDGWAGAGHEKINQYLRGVGNVDPASTVKGYKTGMQQKVHEAIVELDNLMEGTAVPENIVVMRGFATKAPGELAVGKVYTDKGYMATTVNPNTWKSFVSSETAANEIKVAMRVEVPKGSKGLYIGAIDRSTAAEAELLLPRNTSLRIVSSELDETGRKLIVRARMESAEVAELRAAQTELREALGLPEGSVVGAHIKQLLRETPEAAGPKIAALDRYHKAVRALAESMGDAKALAQLDVAGKSVAETAKVATNGIDLAGLKTSLDELTAASATPSKLGTDALVGGALTVAGSEMEGTPGTIAQLAGAYKLGKAGVGSKAGRGFLRRVANGSARSLGGRTANKALGMHRGVGSVAGYQVGSKAFGGLFDTIVGQRAIAGVTGNGVDRIVSALGSVGKVGAKAVAAGQLSAMSLIRSARFDYGQREPKPARTDIQAAYRDRLDELAAIAANPMAAQQAAYDQLAEVRKVAPYVADELEMLATAVPQFLYEKAPKDPGTMTRLGQSTWKPPEYEIRQWGEYVKGALAPLETLEAAMSGRITPQAAEAVRTLFPNLFGKMQETLVEQMPELRKRMDLQARTRLSILFDAPLDSTMLPEFRGFIAERNAIRAAEQQQAKPRGNSGGGSNNSTPAGMTGAQQLLD